MPGRKLAWVFYPAYMAITASALLVIALYASRSVHRFHVEHTTDTLRIRGGQIGREIAGLLRSGGPAAVDRACKERGRETATRITVVLPSGLVAGDSEDDPAAMDNHASRIEISEALAGRVGTDTRRSPTLNRAMMYVAVPLMDDGRIVGAVRTSLPLDEVEGFLQPFYLHLALVGIAIAAAAAVAGVIVFRRISLPIGDLMRGAERFAAGDLSGRIPLPDAAELRDLAKAMNRMAELLDDRMKTVSRQRNEQEAVLGSMLEGVLAVDSDERILSMNGAAARMLGLPAEPPRGTSIPEAVRNADLQRFAIEALAAPEPVEGSVTLRHEGGERFLQVRGAMLKDAGGGRIGAVIVLNDVTRLKKLENVRKEFVANVSHELKTPVTAIKGYLEAIRDGATGGSEETVRFLGIAAKHADRLDTIIDDLLLLSRLEQDRDAALPALEETQIAGVLEEAVESCSARAREKGIAVEISCPPDLQTAANPELLVQAVTNLLDNAIKYSESGVKVEAGAVRDGGDVVISVRDRGCGIPAEMLPRLGERFFRADKARSRSQGGTGLGLAIVKHIAAFHGGSMSVESKVGEGSTFSIRLPLRHGANPGPSCGKSE